MFWTQLATVTPSRFRSILTFSLLCGILLVGSAAAAFAQITPAKDSLSGLYPGKAYSPYAERTFP